jgi:hypothetical protein
MEASLRDWHMSFAVPPAASYMLTDCEEIIVGNVTPNNVS